MKFLRSPVSKNSPQESSRQIEPVLVSGLISGIHFIFISCFVFFQSFNIFYLSVCFSVSVKKRKNVELIGINILVARHIYRALMNKT